MVWLLCLGLVMGCAGQTSSEKPVAPPPEPKEVLAAQAQVARLHAAMMEIMKAGPELGYAGRKALVMDLTLEIFDLPTMARLTYGPGWASLDVEQRALWIETYSRFQASSTAEVRDRYRGQVYRMLGYEVLPEDRVLIETQLDYPGRAVDFYTNYLLRRTDQGWKIVDVFSPPSVSEVAMRRAEYQTVLEKSGFSGLVEDMERRMKHRSHP